MPNDIFNTGSIKGVPALIDCNLSVGEVEFTSLAGLPPWLGL